MTTTTTMNLADRYKAAMRDLRDAGFCARNNVKKCCRSCVGASDFPTWDEQSCQPILWTFGGQGNAVTIYGNIAYRDGYKTDKNYINHQNMDESMWEIAKSIYEKNGIYVEWTGEQHSCIIIDYTKSVPNNEDNA